MSLLKETEMTYRKYIDELAVDLGTGKEKVKIRYDVVGFSMENGEAVAKYSITVGDIESPFRRSFPFTYTGGDFTKAAEAAMLAHPDFSGCIIV